MNEGSEAMGATYIGVRELQSAAKSAGYTMEKLMDPSQGYNIGWGLFFGGEYVEGSFSFKLEAVNERLCGIGRTVLQGCEFCGYDATEYIGGRARCLDCQLGIEAEDKSEEEEPTQEQQDALARYIEAREEHQALLDDIHYGSTAWERAEARTKLPAATLAKIEAHNEAHRLGVLEVGRSMFR